MNKSIDDYFFDWEKHYFGFGYGTGEEYTIPALKKFMELVPEEGGYDYQELEKQMGSLVAWLYINILCHANIFNYGTSPRYAWLEDCGKELKKYLQNKDIKELLEGPDNDYTFCGPDYCNCGPNGYEEGRICKNPFFYRRHLNPGMTK